ncbi:Transcriptional activator-like protein [Hapsidospora chrysogenum ATCC 11550]|uniref:Transcriptional activator-like protein n=1 Tax=Hapsidospora chrysogenum (strain ATCC 11550 / CBS 779.69 / DSM 880 / IAM 14645 / JCM 23072 / IMI 49137) TaxID=857340 RepID=A0A086T188_HAPC1|nr:Transcriptional activator-like protein [Hapsidospora chrysogenum ATCC 11550]
MDPQNPSGSAHSQQNRAPPVYDTAQGGHYGYAPAELYTGPWANVHQGLTGQYKDILTTYWQQTISHLETEKHEFKIHQLPLARIKKVMKADPEVKMISAEAPILFAKGCDIFITELTMRAWIHAEENKRRTLQRSDIASALAKSDMFDFLIDIVPREEASSHAKRNAQPAAPQAVPAGPGQPQMPGQHASMAQAGNHASSHPLGPGDYMGGHALAPDQDYRQNPNMYPGQVPPGPSPSYGQAQPPMYGEMEGMYPYPAMQAQQAPMSSEDFD